VVPELGSIGASGDLIPLAYVAGAVVGLSADFQLTIEDGSASADRVTPLQVSRNDNPVRPMPPVPNANPGRTLDCITALQEIGVERISLMPKEGLALTNGTSFMSGMAALVVRYISRRTSLLDRVCCMLSTALLPLLHYCWFKRTFSVTLQMHDILTLFAAGVHANAMATQALRGSNQSFHPFIHELKPHRGQVSYRR